MALGRPKKNKVQANDPRVAALRAAGRLPTQDPKARESAKAIISQFHQRLGDNLLEAEENLRQLAFGVWVEEFVDQGEEVTRRVYQEKPDVRALDLYIKLFTGEPKKIIENVHELGSGAQNTLADMIQARADQAAEYWDKQPDQQVLPLPAPEQDRGAGDDPAYKDIEGEFVEIVDREEIVRKLMNGE